MNKTIDKCVTFCIIILFITFGYAFCICNFKSLFRITIRTGLVSN